MAQIITYPKLSTLANNDLLIVSDVSSVNKTTNSLEVDTLAQHIIVTNNIITGGGTVRQIPMFTPTGVIIGDSIMRQSAGGTEIQLGGNFNVNGNAVIDNDLTADRGNVINDFIVGADLSVTGQTETGTLIVNSTLEVNGQATFYDNILLDGGLRDNGGSFGTAGQVLSSTGPGVEWVNGGGTVKGTGTTNTLPLWSDGPAGVLGDSPVVYDPIGHAAAPTVDIVLPSQTFEFRDSGRFITGAMSAGNTFNNATIDIQGDANGRAATFRGGVIVSTNPGGVQVDNTSVVIGGGANDIVSGSDHCLVVGNGNQITSNSDQSVAFGQGNTITGSTDATAAGNNNTINSSLRTQAFGFNNTINSDSSFVAGGDNSVTATNNSFILGYNHTVTGTASKSFLFGQNITLTGGQSNYAIGTNLDGGAGEHMVIGYRNYPAGYPTPNKNLGLGDTKFIVAVGSGTATPADNNAIIITEGGINGGSSGLVPQVPRIFLPQTLKLNAVSDASADAIGVPEGGVYSNNGILQINKGGSSNLFNPGTSMSVGVNVVAHISGFESMAAGDGNTVTGSWGFAFGTGNLSTSVLGFVGGGGSQTSGIAAIAYGNNVQANGSNSAAFGSFSTASGDQSFAAGQSAQALGQNSMALGGDALAQDSLAGPGVTVNTADYAGFQNLLLANYAGLNYTSDAAAAAGGVPLGGIYHNAGDVKIRLV